MGMMRAERILRIMTRLGFSLMMGVGAALVFSVVYAIADIYVTGHGGVSLNRPVGNMSMGMADILLLGISFLVALWAWNLRE